MNINVDKVMLIVNAPKYYINKIKNAIFECNGGIIGNYTHCSTSTKCISTFIPNINANPTIGKNNKLEIVEEIKLEVICNTEYVQDIVSKIKKIHPYEEPVIYVLPLIQI